MSLYVEMNNIICKFEYTIDFDIRKTMTKVLMLDNFFQAYSVVRPKERKWDNLIFSLIVVLKQEEILVFFINK